MKKYIKPLLIGTACALILTSCGANTADIKPTTATAPASTSATTTITTTAAQTTTPATTVTQPTTATTTVKAAAKKTNAAAKKTNAAAKKTATKAKTTAAKPKTTKPKTTTTTKKQGLSYEDLKWAQDKANEYIASLPHCYLNPEASGYTIVSGCKWFETKEEALADFKEAIDVEYKDAINNAGWKTADMYLKLTDEGSHYTYYVMITYDQSREG